MQFLSTVALSACFAGVLANGWNNTITSTYWHTTTDFVTYCPAATTITVTTCTQSKCAPKVITATEATTITVTGECVVPQTTPPAGLVTTDYVTVCPLPTTFTVTTCNAGKTCGPHTVTVAESKTVTVTGECYVPTSEKPAPVTTTKAESKATTPTTVAEVSVTKSTTPAAPAAPAAPASSAPAAPAPAPSAPASVAPSPAKPTTVAEQSTVKPTSAAPSASFVGAAGQNQVAGLAAVAGLGLLML